jgi:ankyrin repeat protein
MVTNLWNKPYLPFSPLGTSFTNLSGQLSNLPGLNEKTLLNTAESKLIPSLQILARAAIPFPFLALPLELQSMIANWLDTPDKLALTDTCHVTKNIYTAEQRQWLALEKHFLTLTVPALHPHYLSDVKIVHDKKNALLTHYYRLNLACLLDETINDKTCEERAAFAEKFFALFSRTMIKQQLNQVLATKPQEHNWFKVFDRLARVNLHLCVTLITLASPGFDPANENVIYAHEAKRLHYPFTEFYPLLIEKLQFRHEDVAPSRSTFSLPDNINFNNARAKQFFRQIHTACCNTALHFAINAGYLEIVPALIQDHRCIDLIDENGSTALVWLVKRMTSRHRINLLGFEREPVARGIKTLHVLLNLKADLNIATASGSTALIYASSELYTDIKVVIALLDAGAHIDQQNNAGETALMHAAANNRIDIICELTARGTNLNLQNKRGETALDQSLSEYHNIRVMRALLAAGAQIDQQNSNGETVLMRAAANGNIIAAFELIDRGANLNLQSKHGDTALINASSTRYTPIEIVTTLLRAGAYIDQQNNEGETALMRAVVNNRIDIVHKFIAQGANLNLQNKYGDTALMYASSNKSALIEIMTALLNAGAYIDQQNNEGETALMHAVANNRIDIVHKFIAQDANLNLQSKHGDTALMYAIANQYFGIAALLQKSGANPTIKSSPIKRSTLCCSWPINLTFFD